jgi:hypothetical protein
MATYVPLQSVVLTSSTTSVTFSGIDQNYTDLVIAVNGTANTGSYFTLRFNNDTTSLYSNTEIDGNGSAAASNRNSSGTYMYNGSIIATQSNIITHINGYSNSTAFKTAISRSNYASTGVKASVGLWRSTAAITSIECGTGGSNTFSAGTTFDLYGIKSGAPQALGGDTVTTDGNYWYHTFRSTGAFIPQKPLSVDYLVVAGGGSGGNHAGGGGGAGGLRSTVTATGGGGSLESALSVTAQAYTITVGAGGAGLPAQGASSSQTGNNGNNSTFSTITSTGGGGGGAIGANTGKTGGSGGGGFFAGTGTANQGFAGGSGTESQSGGGGGAGGAGSTPNGGSGVASSISGSSVTYAGGGGGSGSSSAGTGGSGGGGNGGTNNAANNTAGTANTGGGGGGQWYSVSGAGPYGAGGSGIVIVRYPV